MKLNSFWSLISHLALLLGINLLIFLNVDFYYIPQFIVTLFLLLYPGYLISKSLNLNLTRWTENIIYFVGLSLSYLMLDGLIINYLLPFMHISNPLSTTPVLFSIDFFSLISLLYLDYKKNLDTNIHIKKINVKNKFLVIYPILFICSSIMGAILLNNGGNATFSLLSLFLIAIYFIAIIILRKKIKTNIFAYAIFSIAFSILLSSSLRGWYISGHDIKKEYFVFELTKNASIWSINSFADAYNACLSLNILPTIISNLLIKLPDVLIFKVIYQFIFSLSAVSIFFIFKKYSNNLLAFLSTFYFISFPLFINDLTMLNRQEIALFFNALMLLVMFNPSFSKNIRKILFFIFGVSMILSHYSTYYISILIFLLAYLTTIIYKKGLFKFFFSRFKNTYSKNLNLYLSGWVLLLLFLFAFMWNGLITKTSKGLTDVVENIYLNSGSIFSDKWKSNDIIYSIVPFKGNSLNKLLKDYVSAHSYVNNNYNSIAQYQATIKIVQEDILPKQKLGNIINSFGLDIFKLNSFLRQSAAQAFQILLVIGVLLITFSKKIRKKFDLEYILIAYGSTIVILSTLLLPFISIEYNLSRAFQQGLTILALPSIFSLLFILKKFKSNLNIYLISSFCLFLFLLLSGFITQLLGEYYPQLRNNNSGLAYDAFYTHRSDMYAGEWLTSHNIDKKVDIQADQFNGNNLLYFNNLNYSQSVLPSTVDESSYVYLGYSNVIKKIMLLNLKGNLIEISYPIKLLDDNKDLIYNNNFSRIYK